MVKLAALDVACEMVTLSPPVFVSVSLRVWPVPIWTLPKLKLVGLALTSPAATPVPERAMFSGLFDPSLVSARFPLALPAAAGAKTILTAVLCPTASVKGNVNPVTLNPDPVTVDSVSVRLLPPVLVSVTD